MVKITIIITTYNSSEFIVKTVDSILNQEGKGIDFDIEVIAVDDCSPDGTLDVLKQLDVIALSTETNSGGPNAGRNIALKKATGDYICLTDHDDEWALNRLSSILPYVHKAPIITTGYEIIDSVNNRTTLRYNPDDITPIHYSKNETFLHKLSKKPGGQNTHLGCIMFNCLLKDTFFEDSHGAVDFDWVLRLFYQQESIEIPILAYTRIVDGSNLSLNENYRKADFNAALKYIESKKSEFPKEAQIGLKRVHGTIARYYYLIDNMKMARKYLRKAPFTLKTIMYYLTSYIGSGWVKKKFHIFG
ncbi:MAG: glycosyltransferase [Crocinitomicaceae bacterium]|nr:glycosyltransferase [Crocinitomicaceae bacterium]